jgi:diguanylate cyclase (GGDEF)-like protein
MATHDSLTQLWNRHSIMEILTNELARCEREQTTLALVLVDLDYFKQINDVHGHLAGDAVLREISRRFLSCMRPYDSAGRYGGEEFLLVLSGVPAAELEMRLREIHRNVCAGEFPTSGQGQVRVTCSFGVVRAGAELTSVEQVVSRADAALYRAKALGRNRIEYAEEGECPGEVRKQSVNDRGASKVGLQR